MLCINCFISMFVVCCKRWKLCRLLLLGYLQLIKQFIIIINIHIFIIIMAREYNRFLGSTCILIDWLIGWCLTSTLAIFKKIHKYYWLNVLHNRLHCTRNYILKKKSLDFVIVLWIKETTQFSLKKEFFIDTTHINLTISFFYYRINSKNIF